MSGNAIPDDIATWLLLRFGREWIDMLAAYRGLAESRGVPLSTVLEAASRDQLAEVVQLERRG